MMNQAGTASKGFRWSSLLLSSWRPTARNRRGRTLLTIAVCLAFLVAVIVAAAVIGEGASQTDLAGRNMAPNLAHPFGTDWLGRDMLQRTIVGLSMSVRTGFLAAGLSGLMALILGVAAGVFGGWVDRAVTWLVDVFLSLPHLVAIILIAFALGGGLHGVVIAVALTHWPRLARVIRGEVLEIKERDYIHLSRKLGHSRWYVARYHLLPHMVPQLLVGTILMFPHAILHEASLTFLGMGLSPHAPAIGIILSESMRYLTAGCWWLAVLPGVALLLGVLAFDALGGGARALLNPRTGQE